MAFIIPTVCDSQKKAISRRSGVYLVKRAVVIVVGEGVLVQEIFFDLFGDFQGEFLVFGERVFTDELHDFVQLFFVGQNLAELGSEVSEFAVELIEVFLELLGVVRVRNVPVD